MELTKNNSRIVKLKTNNKLKGKQINWSVGGCPKKINLALAFGIQRVQISVDRTIGGSSNELRSAYVKCTSSIFKVVGCFQNWNVQFCSTDDKFNSEFWKWNL